MNSKQLHNEEIRQSVGNDGGEWWVFSKAKADAADEKNVMRKMKTKDDSEDNTDKGMKCYHHRHRNKPPFK